jgi:hypothetical protein
MDREFGLFDQFDNRSKAALVGDSERSMDPESELCQADNIGKVQILEGTVIGDVEEDRLDAFRPGHAISWRQLGAISLALLSEGSCRRSEVVSAGVGCS